MAMRCAVMGACWVLLVCCALAADGEQVRPPAIYLEDSPGAVELLDKARRLHEQRRTIQAVIVYQQVIDGYDKKLVPLPDGTFSDARCRAVQLLRADDQLLGAYRDTHQAAAEQLATRAEGAGGAGGVVAVFDRFRLCTAGLDAALHRAAEYLEAGKPQQAIALLDEVATHPDLDARRAVWLRLQAAGALFADWPDRYRNHLAAIERAGDAGGADELRGWAERLRRPPAANAVSHGQVSGSVSIPEPLGAPLWEASLDTSPSRMARRGSVGRTARRRGVVRATPEVFPTRPVAFGDRLYLNDTGTVYALDANSGRVVWSHTSATLNDPAVVQRVSRQPRYLGTDPRGVLVTSDALVTVLGYVQPGPVRVSRHFDDTSLVCLNTQDGEVRWELKPSDVDASLSAASFFGSPIGWSDRAYVLLSRAQTSGFRATYLVAIHIRTGRVAWWRHLWSRASDGRGRHDTTSGRIDAGSVYLTDNAGAVARVRARDGAVVWVSKPTGPGRKIDPRQRRRLVRPLLPSPPVVTDRGLLVLTRHEHTVVLAIDLASGRVTREIKRESLKGCYYLLPAWSGALAVGPTLELIDGVTHEPVWARTLEPQLSAHREGRAAVTADSILVPAAHHLVVLNLADGKTRFVSKIGKTGNVLVMPDQVIVAGADRVHSYQAWERAYRHLTKQIIENPQDPMPPLALAHIALAANKRLVALDAVDDAIDALAQRAADRNRADRPDQTLSYLQRKVFNQVLRFIQEDPHLDRWVRSKLFERLATLANHRADQVAYHLAIGDDLLDAGRYPQAVGHYQHILEDRALAVQIFDIGNGPVGAEAEARRRLTQVIKQYGPAVYTHYETLAAQRLVELKAHAPVDASALIRLAMQYPLSRSASIATVAAAEVLAQRGEYRAAVAQLHRVYRKTKEASLLQRAVGRLVEVYQRLGEPDRAARMLGRVREDHPGLRPLREGLPTRVETWLAELQAMPRARSGAAARIGRLIGRAVVHNQRVLVPADQARETWPTDAVVTVRGSELRYCTGPDLSVRWRFRLPNDRVDLISFTADQVLIRSGSPGVLIALDARSGKPAWPAVSIQDLLAILGPVTVTAVPSRFERSPGIFAAVNLRPVAPPGAHARIRANGSVICLAGSGGAASGTSGGAGLIVALDRQTGETMWRLVSPIGAPRSMQINDQVVVISGEGVLRSSNIVGRVGVAVVGGAGGAVLVIDAMTGEPWHPPIAGRQPLLWVRIGHDALMVHCTAKKVVAYDLYTGRVNWWQPVNAAPPPAAPPGPPAGLVGDDLVMVRLRDPAGQIYLFDAQDGHVLNRLAVGGTGRLGPIDYQRVGDTRHILTGHRAIAVSADGAVVWQDAVHLGHTERLILQIPGRDHVYLFTADQSSNVRLNANAGLHANVRLNANVRPDDDRVGYTYRVYCLARREGTLIDQFTVTLEAPIERAQSFGIDGALIVATAHQTTVLPGVYTPAQ